MEDTRNKKHYWHDVKNAVKKFVPLEIIHKFPVAYSSVPTKVHNAIDRSSVLVEFSEYFHHQNISSEEDLVFIAVKGGRNSIIEQLRFLISNIESLKWWRTQESVDNTLPNFMIWKHASTDKFNLEFIHVSPMSETT